MPVPLIPFGRTRLAAAVKHVGVREQFGGRLAALQAVRFTVADGFVVEPPAILPRLAMRGAYRIGSSCKRRAPSPANCTAAPAARSPASQRNWAATAAQR